MDVQMQVDILCKDYWETARWYSSQKTNSDLITPTQFSQLKNLAYQKAADLGYTVDQLGFELVNTGSFFIAYLAPKRTSELIRTGGDLFLLFDKSETLLCFHRGA